MARARKLSEQRGRTIAGSAYLGAIVPDSADVHNTLGIAFAEKGRIDEAIAEFAKRSGSGRIRRRRIGTWVRRSHIEAPARKPSNICAGPYSSIRTTRGSSQSGAVLTLTRVVDARRLARLMAVQDTVATAIPAERTLTKLNSNQIKGFWAAWGGWTLDGMDAFI